MGRAGVELRRQQQVHRRQMCGRRSRRRFRLMAAYRPDNGFRRPCNGLRSVCSAVQRYGHGFGGRLKLLRRRFDRQTFGLRRNDRLRRCRNRDDGGWFGNDDVGCLANQAVGNRPTRFVADVGVYRRVVEGRIDRLRREHGRFVRFGLRFDGCRRSRCGGRCCGCRVRTGRFRREQRLLRLNFGRTLLHARRFRKHALASGRIDAAYRVGGAAA